MSLKLRNAVALVLLLLAAVSWTLGQEILDDTESGVPATTGISGSDTEISSTIAEESTPNTDASPVTSSVPSEQQNSAQEDRRGEKWLGLLLFFAAAAAAGTAIFAFSQKGPLCGADGLLLLASLLISVKYLFLPYKAAALSFFLESMLVFILLTGIRELFGWMRAKFSLSWCLVQRLAGRTSLPQLSLLLYAAWITLSLAGFFLYLFFGCLSDAYRAGMYWLPLPGFLAAAAFGFFGLWKYGADLSHFKKQLNRYQTGLPIAVGGGAFAQAEAQLLKIQAQHEEAVRTAVTSERFKVELISNVSHDLRTPLTSILGYSELLEKEALSPEGKKQLRRLHQKAGYMNDLVEALFELTKVSSGVAKSKKEEIDLVRLLEQTIGLFDDQLTHAGLTVRRSYGADAIPVVTDGARMHQVFANLLGNAIKYALAGTRIYLEVKETEGGYLVRMMNTASYEMDFRPDEIVQRFARGDKARSTKGSGLGLAIAQTYTESVGGAFRVQVDGDQFSALVELPKMDQHPCGTA